MRIGARFPNAGVLPAELGLAVMARRIEGAGFDSLWTSDHLGMPEQSRSTYPFSDDGSIPWSLDLGWSDALVALRIAAAVTERVELGTAILVAPLRHPLITAIQVASISVEAGGRVALGVGVGWLAEEFDAVGVPFAGRGRRLDEWIRVATDVWAGRLPVRDESSEYPNPTELICRPTPMDHVPVLVGGLSPAALRRAGQICDGWIGLQPATDLDTEELRTAISAIRTHAREAGRTDLPRVTLQITGSVNQADAIAARLADLDEAGVDEVIVDIDWSDPDGPEKVANALGATSKTEEGLQ